MKSQESLPSAAVNCSVSAGTRRQLLTRLGIAAGASFAAQGCSDVQKQVSRVTGPTAPTYAPLPSSTQLKSGVLRVANRIASGPRPGDLQHIAAISPAGYIEEQLGEDKNYPDDPAVDWRVNALDTQQTQKDAPDAMYSMEYEQLLRETQQAAILRAVYSRRQLRETLADFWTNHLNIYALKSDGQALVPVDTETVIRPNIWNFPDMLLTSAHSPAMLNYLDNQQNKRGVANENYARELLELHTLGVNSGYTLKDIQEVARCFTGWTIKTGFQRGQFEFDPALHDRTAKFIPFLNLSIKAGGGKEDAETILQAVAHHPATARFVTRKLCMRFLGCVPDHIHEQSANAYLVSHGDIRAALRPILLDGLMDPQCVKPILKRPLDLVISALRSLAADTDGAEGLQKHLAAMGQPLYQWPMPDGFPEKPTAWSSSMLPRWNFALALASNAIEGTRVDLNAPVQALDGSASTEKKVEALVSVVLGLHSSDAQGARASRLVSEHWKQAQSRGISESTIMQEATALLIASPGFQWKPA